MVLFKYIVFVNLARKLIQDSKVKSEVIFRQCSSGVIPATKQITLKHLEIVNNLNNEEGKPILRVIPDTVDSNHVKKNEIQHKEQLSSLFEIHRGDFHLDDALHGFTPKLPKALDPSTEDLSDLGTNPFPSFNIASFADKSRTIQEFVKLGVELWRVEKYPGVARLLISLDFEKDVQPYIRFLYDSGVPADQLGAYISNNPRIFKSDLDDLRTRVRYLRAHDFSSEMIATILTKNPRWLNFSTRHIDTRLGYFQNEFKLRGHQVRLLTIKMPKLITYAMIPIEKKSFAISREMGFDLPQMRRMLLSSPRLWTRCCRNLVDTFDYAHNTMNLSHEMISQEPQILLCRKIRLESRHKFLVELKRAQYDPLKPKYVSPKSIVSGTDTEFCEKVANTSIATYHMFLKSL